MSKASYDITIIMAPMWNVREPWTAPAYICEALRAKGYRVQFLDYNIHLYRMCERLGYGHLWLDDAYLTAWGKGELNWLAHWPDLAEIEGGVIGFSATETNLAFSVALATLVRERYPRRKIVFGGHQVFFQSDVARVPASVADAICKGEGERTICQIMERGFERLDEVTGLYLPNENGWQLTSEPSLERDLDSIAWPRFEEIDLGQYGKRFLPLMGSRGCIGRCIFCSDRRRTAGFRYRSARDQVDELEYLSERFDVEHFPYNDPLLNGDLRMLEEKSGEIVRRGLEVRYGGNMMVRKQMPREMFDNARKSGLCVALIGVESGSATTLRHMRKRHTPEMASRFVRDCHAAGIKTLLNFIIGFPTETEEHFEETLRFIRENRASIGGVMSATTFCMVPSDLWERMDEFGVVLHAEDEPQSWYAQEGANSFEVRMARLDRFLAEVAEFGLAEDGVLSDKHLQNNRRTPTGAEFLSACARLSASAAQHDDGEYRAATAGMRRLRAAVTPSRNPISLLKNAVSTLRRQGLSSTVRRAREWAQLSARKPGQ